MGVSSLPLHVDHAHAKHTHERTTPYRDARLSASSIPLHKTLLFWQDLSPTFFSIKKELDWTATEIRQQCSLRARFCSDTLLFLPLLQFVDFVGPKRWPLHTYSKIIQWQADACADVTIWQARRGMRSFHGNIRGGRNTV